jgi:hypothetical protein
MVVPLGARQKGQKRSAQLALFISISCMEVQEKQQSVVVLCYNSNCGVVEWQRLPGRFHSQSGTVPS